MERGLHEAALTLVRFAIDGEEAVAQKELHAQVPAPASEEPIVGDQHVFHEIGVRGQKERGAHDVDARQIAVLACHLVHEPEAVRVEAFENKRLDALSPRFIHRCNSFSVVALWGRPR